MPIILRSGNVLSSTMGILAHGCNCAGVYGAGLAKAISAIYPEAKASYMAKYRTEGWKLGEVQFVDTEGPWVANMATQEGYGRVVGCTYLDAAALSRCLRTVFCFAEEAKLGIATVWVGTGLAQGDPEIVKRIFVEISTEHNVLVEIWTPSKP